MILGSQWCSKVDVSCEKKRPGQDPFSSEHLFTKSVCESSLNGKKGNKCQLAIIKPKPNKVMVRTLLYCLGKFQALLSPGVDQFVISQPPGPFFVKCPAPGHTLDPLF